jgi:hypothetical protein
MGERTKAAAPLELLILRNSNEDPSLRDVAGSHGLVQKQQTA